MATPRPTNRSKAEREIRAAQAKRVKLAEQLDAALNELAATVKMHLDDGASAPEIGTWITSPEKPKGVSRQYVYKLVDERGPKSTNDARPKPVVRPSPAPKPKIKIRPAKRA